MSRHTSWHSRLDAALADLQHHRRARVAVAGDREAGTSALVSAAFDDPLSADGELSVALASRRLNHDSPEAIALTYADKTRTAPHELAIPSAWLRDNNTDVVEVVFSSTGPPLESSLDILHLSDATVLVLSELSLLSPPALQSLLLSLSSKPNLFLALNVTDPSHTSALSALSHTLSTLLPPSSSPPPHLTLISTSLATTGLDALLSPTPSYTIFQTSYNSSGIPSLLSSLSHSLSSISLPAPEGSTAPSALQLQTASYILEKAIHALAFEGARIRDALDEARADVAALSFVGNEAGKRVMSELGVDESGRMRIPKDEIVEARKQLESLLDSRFAWWKLPIRTDDLVHDLSTVVSTSYLRSFEDLLIFHTGRLLALSSSLLPKIDDLLSTPSFSPSSPPLSSLYSPTHLNKISQAQLESRQIHSTDLSAPLVRRRAQITAPGGPAEVLQAKAQKQVVGATSLGGGSVLGAVVSQLGDLAELGTNVGVGLLGVTLAAWILQRGWGKAKKQFFVDMEQRVTGGLEDDLGAAAQRLVDRLGSWQADFV
ncbi:hypothetical protein RQP46_001468 [Phenoliferia psychrophenolica]